MKEIIDVTKLHQNLWKKINTQFDKDLSAPYLYKTTRPEAYKDLFASIKDSGVPVYDVPVTHALLYFYPGEITDPYGRPSTINIFHGGILVHEERIKNDNEEELSVGIARENARNFLRSNALVYSIALPSIEYHKTPEASGLLDDFENIISVFITEDILEMDENLFLKILLRDMIISTRHLLSLQGISTPEPVISEESTKKLREEIRRFEEVRDYDPLNEWNKCLEVYSKIVEVPNFLSEFEKFYERFKDIPIIKRRNIDGKWEEIKPIS